MRSQAIYNVVAVLLVAQSAQSIPLSPDAGAAVSIHLGNHHSNGGGEHHGNGKGNEHGYGFVDGRPIVHGAKDEGHSAGEFAKGTKGRVGGFAKGEKHDAAELAKGTKDRVVDGVAGSKIGKTVEPAAHAAMDKGKKVVNHVHEVPSHVSQADGKVKGTVGRVGDEPVVHGAHDEGKKVIGIAGGAKDRVSHLPATAKGVVGRVGDEPIAHGAKDEVKKVAGVGGGAKDRVVDSLHDAPDRVDHVGEKVKNVAGNVEKQPVVHGVASGGHHLLDKVHDAPGKVKKIPGIVEDQPIAHGAKEEVNHLDRPITAVHHAVEKDPLVGGAKDQVGHLSVSQNHHNGHDGKDHHDNGGKNHHDNGENHHGNDSKDHQNGSGKNHDGKNGNGGGHSKGSKSSHPDVASAHIGAGPVKAGAQVNKKGPSVDVNHHKVDSSRVLPGAQPGVTEPVAKAVSHNAHSMKDRVDDERNHDIVHVQIHPVHGDVKVNGAPKAGVAAANHQVVDSSKVAPRGQDEPKKLPNLFRYFSRE
ncbi:hypothetical protein BT69DRAFT_1282147 [Atractiella rhizophila]|nr:hypothetical protein BT69DRAFT_1282147 [Atractiella rhizophila]